MTVEVLVDANFEAPTEVGPHQEEIESYIENNDEAGLIRVNHQFFIFYSVTDLLNIVF